MKVETIDVARRTVAEYLAKHSQARWKQLRKAVPTTVPDRDIRTVIAEKRKRGDIVRKNGRWMTPDDLFRFPVGGH